jgi:hypothetical protein
MNHQGDMWARSCRCSVFHVLREPTRRPPGDVRQRQTRPAISARVVGFHEHHNPAQLPTSQSSKRVNYAASTDILLVSHDGILSTPCSSPKIQLLRYLSDLAEYMRDVLFYT